MMHTVLPREEAVEAIFSKIVASPASCEQLREVVYEHLEDEQIFEKNQAEHFTEVLFQAYKNGDISALLLELCGRSMFDLHFDPQALVNVLPVLGKGILGVFAVICAIWALVAIMNRNAGK